MQLNIGQETLKGLFAHWLSQRRASTNKALPPTQASPNGDVSPSLSSGAGDLGSNRRTGLDDAQHEANPQQLIVSPAFEFSTESPPSIITEGSLVSWNTSLNFSQAHRILGLHIQSLMQLSISI